MLEEAQKRYESILQRGHEEFRRRLSDVMVASRNSVYDVEKNIDDLDKTMAYMKRYLQMNPTVITCGVLYKPGYFPNRKRCLELYASRAPNGKIYVEKIENDYNVYLDRDWFKFGMERDSANWSETYFEDNLIPDVSGRRHLTTYSLPVHDKQGRTVALFGSDLTLAFLRYEIMDDLREFHKDFEQGSKHHSYNFVIDGKGNYIIHPDDQRIHNANFYDECRNSVISVDKQVVNRMRKGEQGSAMVEIDGISSWIYFRSVKHMDWLIAIVVPEDVIFRNGRLLNTFILFTMVLGLLIIYFFCRRMIHDITTPVAVQQAAIERELKIAHGIQMAMLPKEFPPYPERSDIDIYASETPAREVGGDLYDYFLRGDRLFFCIGDVSGKGMPAALIMAVVRAMFRSETRRAETAVSIVETMNHNFSDEYTAGYFVTMFVGILDLNTGVLDYCNAAHEAPLVSGRPLPIKPNLPVGALSDWGYEGQQAQLQSGDVLFLYTDGLNEARNEADSLFGRHRVQQIAIERVNETARQLVNAMENEVNRFVGNIEQSDDVTLLAIKWQHDLRLVMRSSMDDIGCLQPYVELVTQQVGLDEMASKRLRLAVEEAVANVINYGQATTVTLRAAVAPPPQSCSLAGQVRQALILTIDDDGKPFDPTQGSSTDFSLPPDQRPPGGMGIVLLQTMTDALEYQRIDGHNILTLQTCPISPVVDYAFCLTYLSMPEAVTMPPSSVV